jgi:3',5'-cyclic AMP phosphodiesterase CpdA
MRIAHLSDLHVLSLEGATASRFFNKRFTGWVNLRLKREHKHRPGHVRAALQAVRRANVDHVIITGDLTNLALEQEFEAAVRMIEEELGLPARDVTVVPGNHDLYTRGALRTRRFSRYFAKYLESDLPELAANLPLGRFPIVKLRGPLAIIGLSSAVPRPPLVASGELGKEQLAALERILDHDEVKKRTPVLALHHPIHNPPSRVKTWVEGLRDAPALIAVLARLPHGLLVHGHLHKRIQRNLTTRVGNVVAAGATSASLHHDDEHRMAGFNVYEFDVSGRLFSVTAEVLSPTDTSFRSAQVPVHG